MSKKRHKDSGINWKKVIFYYIIFGFLLYKGAIFLFTTDYLALREVSVDGFKVLSPNYIVSLAKLKPGVNLLLLDTSKIRQNIKKNPWIEDVTVKKRFFHGISIIVKERTPFCILTNSKEGVVLNSRCIVLTKNIKKFPFLETVVYKKIDFSKISLGKRIENSLVCDTIYIVRVFKENFPNLLKKVEIIEEGYMRFYLKNGLTVIMGGSKDIKDKKKFLILRKIIKTKAKYLKVLDLRYKKGIIGK